MATREPGRRRGVVRLGPVHLGARLCNRREERTRRVLRARDYQSDGIHPAAGAGAKIATMIHERFLEQPWYRAR